APMLKSSSRIAKHGRGTRFVVRRGLMGFARARLVCLYVALIAIVVAASGCKDKDAEGAIRVRSIRFIGVRGVSRSALEDALATRASSRLPWGARRYFYQAQFDDDLKRVQAFYADRGFPNAKVTAFDVKMNAAQNAVDITITVDEGEPIIVSSVTFS